MKVVRERKRGEVHYKVPNPRGGMSIAKVVFGNYFSPNTKENGISLKTNFDFEFGADSYRYSGGHKISLSRLTPEEAKALGKALKKASREYKRRYRFRAW